MIRTIAIVAVILLHAGNDLTVQTMSSLEVYRWWTVDFYQSFGRVGVPLFVMLTGMLLLTPRKEPEGLETIFKKRWVRVGLPFVFWAVVYFLWAFLVNGQAVTANFIIQGVLSGPYYQFWYIYMLLGLYLLTPVLRVMVAHAERSVAKFSLLLWFVGTTILPVVALLTPYHLDVNVLVIPTYVGYYVLGVYLMSVKVKRSYLVALMVLGIALTATFTYVLAATIGGTDMYFFQQYLSPTMILAAVTVFLLLLTVKPPSIQTESSPTKATKFIKVVSENTFPIFLLHVMIIESIQKGYFGFAINRDTFNPIFEVPLLTVIVFFACLAIILLLKKIPYMSKLVG